jgi:hypothetical protein
VACYTLYQAVQLSCMESFTGDNYKTKINGKYSKYLSLLTKMIFFGIWESINLYWCLDGEQGLWYFHLVYTLGGSHTLPLQGIKQQWYLNATTFPIFIQHLIFYMRNVICTIIFVQLLYNFLSHTYIIFLFSLFLFLSPLFMTNEKREQQGCTKSCTKIVVQISLLFLYISLFLIHYQTITSFTFTLVFS